MHCQSADSDGAGIRRRDALLAGGFVATAGVVVPAIPPAAAGELPAESLSVANKRALKADMQARAERELAKVLTGADAPQCMGLVFNDAGTYDIATGTGGMDGSIVLDEELNRPENKALKPMVQKLAGAKKAIDEKSIAAEQGPISWADLLVLAAKLTTQMSWRSIKDAESKDPAGAEIISTVYGTNWSVQLGRTDSGVPAPAGRLPQPDASATEVQSYLSSLGNKNPGESGPFTPKPPFWERYGFLVWTASQPDPAKAEEKLATIPEYAVWKKEYDRSRRTVTRNDYEIDFVNKFTQLTDLGAKYDDLAYLHAMTTADFKL